jgi:hypothetical protein
MARRKRPWLRRTLGVGLLAGAAYAVWRAIEANKRDDGVGWEPQPFPFPPQPRAQDDDWVEPQDDVCPASHPVKAKLGSGIYHLPGGMNYDRTKPDRCYLDAAAAESDGLRPSKI